MSRTLYGLRQSPWTERACWALDHHGVAYTYHEHLPMLGEVLLRRKAKRKKASVPLLADGDTIVMGSFEIAKHAERIGRAGALFPSDTDAEMAHWVDVAERMTRVGRALLLRKAATDRAVQIELLPGFIPGVIRGALAPTAGMALRFIGKKHDVPEDADAEVEHVLRPLLKEVDDALRGRTYLFPTFSFADMAIASSLQVLRARPDSKVPAAVREAWGNPALAEDFPALLKWRDAIYEKHR
jgi:glutathione S-transferase